MLDHLVLDGTRVPEARKAEIEQALEGQQVLGVGLRLESIKSMNKIAGAYRVATPPAK